MLRLILVLTLVTFALGQIIHKPDLQWDSRIVGGTNAINGQIPYQVSLRSMIHFCGGSIITNRWILSAAHCTTGRLVVNTIVVVGSVLMNSGGIVHQASAIINHPDYNLTSISNDVSVVQTATTIIFTAHVQPIALGADFIGGGVLAIGSGWGRTSSEGSAPAHNLKFIQLATITNEECRSRHTTENSDFVFDSTLCSSTQVEQGTCRGDSGGPLTANGQVIGVSSWVIQPCASGLPDAWARVSFYRAWIQNATSFV